MPSVSRIQSKSSENFEPDREDVGNMVCSISCWTIQSIFTMFWRHDIPGEAAATKDDFEKRLKEFKEESINLIDEMIKDSEFKQMGEKINESEIKQWIETSTQGFWNLCRGVP
ncbi:hypothetical protein SAMD00019534_115190 [Acytostelium subglobosum LB1]|uniref:hypothetical protein n=1 Tax=Acytostelium subglobosum LB1 TaxID=1410327 RepID=UPI0006447DC0|nr:hypothetical protein SAMD00019534_115190 [Acytostelium subglobosum LB1]GAM28343.1 hypothetical protein SAMD00019534_115190 [Acytostelium subglobosum LB1]|eukprot:XP_012748660.1 hypothetical protein SAMD00019534_115190 [Acytostelium subglobosum LB1]